MDRITLPADLDEQVYAVHLGGQPGGVRFVPAAPVEARTAVRCDCADEPAKVLARTVEVYGVIACTSTCPSDAKAFCEAQWTFAAIDL